MDVHGRMEPDSRDEPTRVGRPARTSSCFTVEKEGHLRNDHWLLGSGSRFTTLIGDLEKINCLVAGGMGETCGWNVFWNVYRICTGGQITIPLPGRLRQ